MSNPSIKSLLKYGGWGLMFSLAALIAISSMRYLTLDPKYFFPRQREVYSAHSVGLFLHVLGGVTALFLGPFQFISRMRTGNWRWIHRQIGRVYLVAVLVAGLGGLYLGTMAYGGWLNQVGFTCFAVAWLTTGVAAYSAVRARDFESHRRWMIRNYAGTFGAVTLRLWLMIFLTCRMDFLFAYQIVAWLSWVPNLIIVECWIQWRAAIKRADGLQLNNDGIGVS
jgi:uncharacterized membrane protein